MAAKITTLSPELITEIRRVIDQVNRQSRNQIKDSPREVPKAPDDYVVRTPPSGIPGRTSARINAVICDVYREEEIVPGVWGGQKGLVRITDGYGNPYQLPIYNIYCEPVPGDLLVPTALLKSGTRYVSNWFDCESSSSSSDSSSESSSSDSSSSSSSSSSSDSSSESSSSDSESSSDGPCPCSGTCTYVARLVDGGGLAWVYMSRDSTCADPCYCEPPSDLPSYLDQVAQGQCWGPCESSSSSDSSSDSDSDSSSDSDSDSSSDSDSDSDSEPPSDSSSHSGSDSSGACTGQCTWIAVDDSGDSESDSGSSQPSSGGDSSDDGVYTCRGDCVYEWTGSGWSLQDGTGCVAIFGSGPCACTPPLGSGSYVGETRYGDCQAPP